MNILSWTLFGLLTGLVVNLLDSHPSEGGLIGTVILGIAGALVGGFLASLLFGRSVNGFDISSFALSVGGAVILLFIGKAIREA